MHRLISIFVACVFAIPGVAFGDRVLLRPVKDNTLFENATGDVSNGSGPALFAGNNSGMSTRRAVLQFNVADSIPAGATIDSVMLRMHVSNAPNEIPRFITLHHVLVEWGEGASSAGGGGGAQAEPGDATWLHTFYPSAFWSSAGGDFDAAALTSTIVGGVGFYTWSDPALVGAVQMWLDSPSSNFGWLLKGEESEAATARRLDSRENDTEDQQPVLVVDFTPPDVPVEPSTWGQVKTRYDAD